MKNIFKKPFDATGVILDCKSFYTVFCELEERCRIPLDNPEKLNLHDEETDTEKHPFLTPAMVTNGILAAELALKALTLNETGTFDCIHNINTLFYNLSDVHRKVISSIIKEKAHQNDITLKANLDTISNFFTEWRYFFEKEAIGYSNFLSDFIHIVCDYAIENIENIEDEVK